MSLDDPYLVVKEETSIALNKARGLFRQWVALNQHVASGQKSMPQTPNLSGCVLPTLNPLEELQWTTNELRNAIRSLEWDLEDLDDCININEKNPEKFKVDSRDISMRRGFLTVTSAEVKVMKDKLNTSKGRDSDRTANQPINSIPRKGPTTSMSYGSGLAKYSKLENQIDSPNRRPLFHQHHLRLHNDNRLPTAPEDNRPMNIELDERMLDDCGNEMEIITTSRLDATMKKMANILNMNNGNYMPAANTEFASPKPSYMSLCSITRVISNCFVCNRN